MTNSAYCLSASGLGVELRKDPRGATVVGRAHYDETHPALATMGSFLIGITYIGPFEMDNPFNLPKTYMYSRRTKIYGTESLGQDRHLVLASKCSGNQ